MNGARKEQENRSNDSLGNVVGNVVELLFYLECKASRNEASFPPHNLRLGTPRATTI
jgi:hypothetical protein